MLTQELVPGSFPLSATPNSFKLSVVYVPSSILKFGSLDSFDTYHLFIASLYPYAESVAAPTFEFSIIFNMIGTVITAIIANITMIANSSINVKPLFFCISYSS